MHAMLTWGVLCKFGTPDQTLRRTSGIFISQMSSFFCGINLIATPMSAILLHKSPLFSLEKDLRKTLDELENSSDIDIEEALELAEDGEDHWAYDGSEDDHVRILNPRKTSYIIFAAIRFSQQTR
jgi:hypothetical protein